MIRMQKNAEVAKA